MRPPFDHIDQDILHARQHRFDQRPGPRVGDIVLLNDGTMHRFTHDWDDRLQTAPFRSGSYYFGKTGHLQYSGSLDPSIPKADIHDTGHTFTAACWFFHHDHAAKDNGVDAAVTVRVYRYSPSETRHAYDPR